jgi:TolB protein
MFVHVGGAASLNPGEARLSFITVGQSVTETGLNLLPSAFQAPVFSPEGDFILVAAEGRVGISNLVVAKPTGEIQTVIADINGPVAFDWSPSGDYIAYVENTQSSSGFLGNLTFVDLSDPDFPEVIETEAENVIAFFWSPEGDELAYFVPAIAADESGEAPPDQEPVVFLILYIANAADGSTRQVASFLPSESFLNILPFFDQYQRSSTIWSPDGNYMVVSALSNTDGTPGIFIVPSAGSLSPRFLTEGTLAFWSWD